MYVNCSDTTFLAEAFRGECPDGACNLSELSVEPSFQSTFALNAGWVEFAEVVIRLSGPR